MAQVQRGGSLIFFPVPMLLRRLFSSLGIALVFTLGVLTGPRIVVRADEGVPCVPVLEPVTVPAVIDEIPIVPTASPTVTLLFINEILPNPVGKDTDGEFIELFHGGTAEAILDGWRIEDGKGKQFVVPMRIVDAGAFVVIPFSESGITLTNSGGTLKLLSPDGAIAQQFTYPELAEGMVYARLADGQFVESTTPTPGLENVQTLPAPLTPIVPIVSTPEPASDPVPVPVVMPPPSSNADQVVLVPLLSKLLPDPEGSDDAEWIELFNPHEVLLSLEGWVLDDSEGGSAAHTIAAGTTIAPGGYLLMPRATSKLALNNDADSVRLFDPRGVLRDTVSYSGAKSGVPYVLTDSGWVWLESIEEVVEDAGEIIASEPIPEVLPPSELLELPDDTEVMTTGVVTVAPGVFGKTLIALQDDQFPTAITVRVSSAYLDALVEGMHVTLSGKLRHLSSGVRVSMTKDDVLMINQERVPFIYEDAEGVDIASSGPLALRVTGTVSRVQGMSMTIVDSDEVSWKTRLLPSSGSALLAKKGGVVEVRGVLRQQGETSVLLVTAKDAVTVLPKENGSDLSPGTQENGVIHTVGKPFTPSFPVHFVILGLLGAMVGLILLWQKKRALALFPLAPIDNSRPPSYDIRTN